MSVFSRLLTERARWSELTTDQFFEIVHLRYAVYALEQRVDAQDFDESDRAGSTEHWWIRDDDSSLIAYLRLVAVPFDEPMPRGALRADWAVGRMVVRADQRRKGFAQHILQAAMEAHSGAAFVLHAQQYAKSLYEKCGFEVFGAPFDEAGIPHVRMYKGRTENPPL